MVNIRKLYAMENTICYISKKFAAFLKHPRLFKVYTTFFFFICSIKSLQCTDKESQKNFDNDFLSPCFDVPKT